MFFFLSLHLSCIQQHELNTFQRARTYAIAPPGTEDALGAASSYTCNTNNAYTSINIHEPLFFSQLKLSVFSLEKIGENKPPTERKMLKILTGDDNKDNRMIHGELLFYWLQTTCQKAERDEVESLKIRACHIGFVYMSQNHRRKRKFVMWYRTTQNRYGKEQDGKVKQECKEVKVKSGYIFMKTIPVFRLFKNYLMNGKYA